MVRPRRKAGTAVPEPISPPAGRQPLVGQAPPVDPAEGPTVGLGAGLDSGLDARLDASLRTRLPSLNALRVFHVAFQHRSLRKASEDLSVTPQAVGQQLKLLEQTLNVSLFERHGRALQPTEAGVLLASFVKSGFSELAEGVRRVTRSLHRSRISINVSPYFATHYFIPTLSLAEAPVDAEIRLSTAVHLPEFDRDEVDLAIQWGYSGTRNWGGLEATLLLADPKVICCTPLLAQRLQEPADLCSLNLLNLVPSNRLWKDIFRHLGLDARQLPPHRMGFDDAATIRRATLQGIGVGLLSPIHADEDLASGQLVAPLGREALSDMPAGDVPGFHLLAPRSRLRVPSVARLYHWLLGRAW